MESQFVQLVTVDAGQMNSVLMEQKDFLLPVVQEAVQAILEVEMEECLQAGTLFLFAELPGYY